MNALPRTRPAQKVDAAERDDRQSANRRRPGAGRRRDPQIDGKIRHAARVLYAADGWAGFHFDGVAKAAGVSKDAVYRRYPDRQSLLLDALADQAMPALSDGGSIEEALVAYALEIFDYVTSGDGYANLRIHLDGGRYPEVLTAYQQRVVEPALARDIEVVRRARDAGQLSRETNCEAVITAISGALLIFALSRRSPDDARSRSGAIRQIREMVHQIL
jgi:AcrR family transcriptional regulator